MQNKKGSDGMEIVLCISADKFQRVKELLLKDDIASRASIAFKEAKEIAEEGEAEKAYYCYIAGVDEQCERALELVKVKDESGEVVEELATEVTGEEKEKVINKLKEEENKAIEGFGGIFG